MSEQRVSDERLAAAITTRERLELAQNSGPLSLMLDLRDARQRIAALEAGVRELRAAIVADDRGREILAMRDLYALVPEENPNG